MRQDVARQDAAVRAAREARRHDELLLADRQHLAVDHARHRRPVDDADHHDEHPDAGLADGRRQGDRQQQDGEGQHHVGGAHHEGLEPAAEVAGDDAEDHPEKQREAVGQHADGQADAGAVDEAAE